MGTNLRFWASTMADFFAVNMHRVYFCLFQNVFTIYCSCTWSFLPKRFDHSIVWLLFFDHYTVHRPLSLVSYQITIPLTGMHCGFFSVFFKTFWPFTFEWYAMHNHWTAEWSCPYGSWLSCNQPTIPSWFILWLSYIFLCCYADCFLLGYHCISCWVLVDFCYALFWLPC